jgi:hypothetical protein
MVLFFICDSISKKIGYSLKQNQSAHVYLFVTLWKMFYTYESPSSTTSLKDI